MVHTVTITQDLPLLHLEKDDVLLVDEQGEIELYRPLDKSYARVLQVLVERDLATTSLSDADLAALASERRGQSRAGTLPVLLAARDRQGRDHLKLA